MYPIHASFGRVLTYAHSASLKLQQVNARTQAKVVWARARVCQGLATSLCTSLVPRLVLHSRPSADYYQYHTGDTESDPNWVRLWSEFQD